MKMCCFTIFTNHRTMNIIWKKKKGSLPVVQNNMRLYVEQYHLIQELCRVPSDSGAICRGTGVVGVTADVVVTDVGATSQKLKLGDLNRINSCEVMAIQSLACFHINFLLPMIGAAAYLTLRRRLLSENFDIPVLQQRWAIPTPESESEPAPNFTSLEPEPESTFFPILESESESESE